MRRCALMKAMARAADGSKSLMAPRFAVVSRYLRLDTFEDGNLYAIKNGFKPLWQGVGGRVFRQTGGEEYGVSFKPEEFLTWHY